MASGPPGRADGRVGRAGPGSPVSDFLSCTCEICAMYEMRWQRSTSFNSFCTPGVSTRASCVCASSPDSGSRGSKTAGEPTVTPTAIKNTRASRSEGSHGDITGGASRGGAGRARELPLSNGVKASALVSPSCRTVMLLNAISHRRRGGSQT